MKLPSSILRTMLVTTGTLAASAAVVGVATSMPFPEASPSSTEYLAKASEKKPKPKPKPTATPTPLPPEVAPIESFGYECPACGMG